MDIVGILTNQAFIEKRLRLKAGTDALRLQVRAFGCWVTVSEVAVKQQEVAR